MRRPIARVDPAGGGKERAVSSHREEQAEAGQNRGGVAAKRRENYRERDERGAGRTDQRGSGALCDSRDAFHLVDPKRVEIRDVDDEVYRREHEGAAHERAWYSSSAGPDFARGVHDEVPRLGRRQHRDHRDTKRGERPVKIRRHNWRELRMHPAKGNRHQRNHSKAGHLCDCEDCVGEIAAADTDVVDGAQRDDRSDGDEFRSRNR